MPKTNFICHPCSRRCHFHRFSVVMNVHSFRVAALSLKFQVDKYPVFMEISAREISPVSRFQGFLSKNN